MSVLSYMAFRRSNPYLFNIILMSKVCFICGGVTIIKNDSCYFAITDAPMRCKYCILDFAVLHNLLGLAGLIRKSSLGVAEAIILSLYNLHDLFAFAGVINRKNLQGVAEIFYGDFNISFFRILMTKDFVEAIKRKTTEERSKDYVDSMRMLIPQPELKVWGERRAGNKTDMIAQIVGYRPRINSGRDTACMQLYLNRVSKSDLDQPRFMKTEDYLPAGAPLLDFLVEESLQVGGWKYPKLDDLRSYQHNRGLSLRMLEQMDVRELVCGVSSRTEILEVSNWVRNMHMLDQERFGTKVISLDVEDVKVTFYDTLRMAGKIQIPGGSSVLRSRVESELIYGFPKDDWRQIPGKIMFGNGISWTCLISLNLEHDDRYRYIVKKMEVQSEILDLIRDLPVAAGLAIRRDLQGVEEFYSLISGEELVFGNGFVDLTTLAILAGYKLQARNMTAMGVQVMGTLLNKTVSTGDETWGLRWKYIPKCLQCYALGDIKFGFITYSVLAGLLLRDVFPDPDMVCRTLRGDQKAAVDWFLEFVMESLDSVEFHQAVEELAGNREEMIRSLRLRDQSG